MQNPLRKLWRDWIVAPAIMIMIVGPFKSAVADWNWVPSGSMKPSIYEGDLVLVNKLAYDLKVPFTTQHPPPGAIRTAAMWWFSTRPSMGCGW